MDKEKKANTIRYNILILDEIVNNLRKETSFREVISKERRYKYIKTGECERTRMETICGDTNIDQGYFTGEVRFSIPQCEKILDDSPHILSEIGFNKAGAPVIPGIPGFKAYIDKIVVSFENREYIEDENLERLLYYVKSNNSIEGYSRFSEISLANICRALKRLDFQDISKADTATRRRFITLAEEKTILCKAVTILNEPGSKSVGPEIE